MIDEPKCWTRNCKWFEGVKADEEPEGAERPFCKAFPDGIPVSIAYGNNPHDKLQPGQEGDYLYQPQDWK